MRRLLLGGVVVLFMGACQASPETGGAPTDVPAAPESTEVALDFVATDLEGSDVHLSSLRGKVVLVNFWASWCPPCQDEMPLLQLYYETHAEDGFVLLGLNVSDQPDTIEAIIDEFELTFPVWRDPLGDIMLDMNVRGLPTSIVIDSSGHQVFAWLGPFDEASLDEHITPLIIAP